MIYLLNATQNIRMAPFFFECNPFFFYTHYQNSSSTKILNQNTGSGRYQSDLSPAIAAKNPRRPGALGL